MSYTIARSMANWRRDIEKYLTKNTANKLRYMYGGEHVYIPKVHDIERAVRLVEEDHIAVSSARQHAAKAREVEKLHGVHISKIPTFSSKKQSNSK